MSALARHGVHGPNCALGDFRRTVDSALPDGAPALWRRAVLAGARWVKLLWPDHTVADAQAARALGLHVLLRVPGEGAVHWEQVADLITRFAGWVDVLELGNEPDPAPARLWAHAWYLEQVVAHCLAPAHAAGMQLCAPGWRADLAPPPAGDLTARLQRVYAQCDALAVHAYDPYSLTGPAVAAHLAAWHAWLPTHPGYITEYGIAVRSLGEATKAARYAAFVQGLPEWVVAAFAFLLGGTRDFAAFGSAGYDPAGGNGYWLSDAGWAQMGEALGA